MTVHEKIIPGDKKKNNCDAWKSSKDPLNTEIIIVIGKNNYKQTKYY